MVGEDIRSHTIRNMEGYIAKDKVIQDLKEEIEGYDLAKLAEKTQFIRTIENLQMRVRDLLMQQKYHLQELKRRD